MSLDVVTFGCRLNIAESEVIRRAAGAAGLDDAVVVNTCAVTAEAVRQARQSIRRIKRERPQARIVVTGCAAQTEPATFAGMAEVDRVIGNAEKLDPRMWAADDWRIAVGDIMAVTRHTAHADRQHRGPHARLPAGAERLRPSLHVLHHSVRARQCALAADGRGSGAGAPARRARLSRTGAHRRRYHQLRRGACRRAAARRAGQAHSERGARPGAAAAVLDRFGGGR